jgi:hypothetical protein
MQSFCSIDRLMWEFRECGRRQREPDFVSTKKSFYFAFLSSSTVSTSDRASAIAAAMAALRHLTSSLRPVASTSASVLGRSSTIAAARCAHQRRSYASEAETAPSAMSGFKQTTVEELHSQSAHEALSGAWSASRSAVQCVQAGWD